MRIKGTVLGFFDWFSRLKGWYLNVLVIGCF